MRVGAGTKAANPPNGRNTENNQSHLRVFRVICGSFCLGSDNAIHESHETHEGDSDYFQYSCP